MRPPQTQWVKTLNSSIFGVFTCVGFTRYLGTHVCIIYACVPTVCRNMEDFVTWTDTSKIRRHVLEYNEEVCVCMCVCVCVHVCVCMYMYVCVCARTRVCEIMST